MNYRVRFMPAGGLKGNSFTQEYETQMEAEAALEVIANYTLFLHTERLMNDHSNFGWIEARGGSGKWGEVLEGDQF